MPSRSESLGPTARKQYNLLKYQTSYQRGIGSQIEEKVLQTNHTHLLKQYFFPKCHSFPRFRTWNDVDKETRKGVPKDRNLNPHFPQPHYWGTGGKNDVYANEKGVVLTKLKEFPVYWPARGHQNGYFCSKSGSNLNPAMRRM